LDYLEPQVASVEEIKQASDHLLALDNDGERAQVLLLHVLSFYILNLSLDDYHPLHSFNRHVATSVWSTHSARPRTPVRYL
jgi:hypothetical protein